MVPPAITVCFTYFKSLTLANLGAALYSVRRQNFTDVESIVVVNNDTVDDPADIDAIVDALDFPVPIRLLTFRHGDPTRTHSWSTNQAVRAATTPWILFTRADYLLDFSLISKFAAVADARPNDWDGFITGNVYHLSADIAECELSNRWRTSGPQMFRFFPGAEADYTLIDAGVWMGRRLTFDKVGGLDENLTAWGHAQTHYQYKLHCAGVDSVRIPEVLYYHPRHGAVRDLDLAHRQLKEHGHDIRAMWARYHGAKPY